MQFCPQHILHERHKSELMKHAKKQKKAKAVKVPKVLKSILQPATSTASTTASATADTTSTSSANVTLTAEEATTTGDKIPCCCGKPNCLVYPNSSHSCKVTGRKTAAWCYPKGTPEGFGTCAACIRCVNQPAVAAMADSDAYSESCSDSDANSESCSDSDVTIDPCLVIRTNKRKRDDQVDLPSIESKFEQLDKDRQRCGLEVILERAVVREYNTKSSKKFYNGALYSEIDNAGVLFYKKMYLPLTKKLNLKIEVQGEEVKDDEMLGALLKNNTKKIIFIRALVGSYLNFLVENDVLARDDISDKK